MKKVKCSTCGNPLHPDTSGRCGLCGCPPEFQGLVDEDYSITQKIGIAVLFLMFFFTLYVWLVRYECLPKPDWFRKIEGPNQPNFTK